MSNVISKRSRRVADNGKVTQSSRRTPALTRSPPTRPQWRMALACTQWSLWAPKSQSQSQSQSRGGSSRSRPTRWSCSKPPRMSRSTRTPTIRPPLKEVGLRCYAGCHNISHLTVLYIIYVLS